MNIQPRKAVFTFSVFLLFLYACGGSGAPSSVELTEIEWAQALEDEVEIEAKRLLDSLRPRKSSPPPRWNNKKYVPLYFKEDMLWLLYDEPVMLYIDDRECRTDSIMVY